MAKKKVVKKSSKKKIAKTKSARAVKPKSAASKKAFHPILETRKFDRGNLERKKVDLVFKKLLLFVGIFIISILGHFFSSDLTLINLFLLLAILSGFIGLAFVIVLLIFLFLKILKR